MTLKRRQFLSTGLLAAGGASTLAAPALAQSQPAVTWRLASSFPKSLELLFGTSQLLAKYVAEATDNNFQIQPFAAGEIAPGGQALDIVTSGVVECAHSPGGYYLAKDVALGCGSGLPFGLNQRQQQAWWAHGGGAQIFNEALKRFNAFGLPMGSGGAHGGGWFRREITTADDFKGLKIRTSGMGGQVLARLGALPQQLTPSEIAPALENGSIDAASVLGPYDDEKLGLASVAKIYHTPGWWDRAATVHLMINLEAWSKLPKPYQAIVAHAAEAANAWMLTKYDTVNAPALKRLVAAGSVIKPFPAPVLDACYKAAGEHYAEIAGQNPLFKKALDSMTAFRQEQAAWWHVSDHGLDAFMSGRQGKG